MQGDREAGRALVFHVVRQIQNKPYSSHKVHNDFTWFSHKVVVPRILKYIACYKLNLRNTLALEISNVVVRQFIHRGL